MRDIHIDRQEVNLALLDADLRAALGSFITGISTNAAGVVVHLTEKATGDHEMQAKHLVQMHRPAALTPAQQAQKARAERLTIDRTRFNTPLNTADFAANLLVQTLAARLAWLEQELRDLRNL